MSHHLWLPMPGVPAVGHISPRGFWHPGSPEGCVKCQAASPEDDGEGEEG